MPDEQIAPNEPGAPAPAPAQWNPVVTFLMILLGIPLLLPGACSLLFTWSGGGGGIAVIGYLIAFGGIAMIISGIRRMLKPAMVLEPAVSENIKGTLLIILLVIFLFLGLFVAALLKR